MRLSDFETLEAARAFETTTGKMISKNEIIGLLASANLYVRFKEIAQDGSHPFQDVAAALLDATAFNFMSGTLMGEQNLAALEAFSQAGLPESAAIQSLKPSINALANPPVRPYEHVTLHEFLQAKNAMPRTRVAAIDGWVKITTTADVEKHNPQISVQPVRGLHTRVSAFSGVEAAGEYFAKVPVTATDVWVDDPYQVIS